jgi:DNA polymerase-3 subunit alpha/error-prone DNA polymerase
MWIEVNIRDTLSKNETKCNEFLSTGKTIGCFISKVLPCVDYCDGLNVIIKNFSSCFLHHTSGCGAKWYDEGIFFRHNHPEQFEYFHETFKEHLETYGVMVYQEDVIKIALHFAEYLPLMEMFCAARWVKGRFVYKSKDNFFACCAKDIP